MLENPACASVPLDGRRPNREFRGDVRISGIRPVESPGSFCTTNGIADGFLKITNEIPIPIDGREPSGFVTLAVRLRGNPPVFATGRLRLRIGVAHHR